MSKPFDLIQIRKDLCALNAEVISISKLVEMFNERAADANAYKWVGFLEELPSEDQRIIVQYKDYKFGETTFYANHLDWYLVNCQCWLKK